MEKKLYRVKVTLYVMAENESEARVAATKAHFDIFECTARKAESVNLGWDNAIPYNAEDERTCAQILAETKRVNAFLAKVRSAAQIYESARRPS